MARTSAARGGELLKSLPRMAIDAMRRGASPDEAEDELAENGVARGEARRAVGVAQETLYRRQRSRSIQEMVGGSVLAVLGVGACLAFLGVIWSAGYTSEEVALLCLVAVAAGVGMVAQGWKTLPTRPGSRG